MRMIECGSVGIDVSVCFHLYHFFSLMSSIYSLLLYIADYIFVCGSSIALQYCFTAVI